MPKPPIEDDADEVPVAEELEIAARDAAEVERHALLRRPRLVQDEEVDRHAERRRSARSTTKITRQLAELR